MPLTRSPRSLPVLAAGVLLAAVLLAAVLLAALLARLPGAEAADPTPGDALRARLEAARKGRASAAWVEALRAVPPVYGRADKRARARLMREAGRAFEAGHTPVKQAALAAIVATGDGTVAWKQALRPVFPRNDARTPGTWDLEVLKAVYRLHPDEAIEPLLKLMKKAKSPVLAAGALRVLGAYERSRKRVHVLERLARIVLANAPGRSRKGSHGSERFLAMATQLEATLNELTGQSFRLREWGPMWKTYKKTPERLFLRPLAPRR